MAMKVNFGLILCIYYLMIVVNGMPNGAPPEACEDMTDIVPDHDFSNSSSNDIPYLVDLSEFEFEDYESEDYNGTYTPGIGYYLYLQSNDASYTFKGFMIQARRVADDSPAGYFMINGTDYQLQCDNETAATHTNNSDKDMVDVYWVAPPAGTGTIRFRYAFVMDFSTFWADLYTDYIEEADSQEPTSTTDEKSDDEGLSAGAIVGIVIGALVGVLILTVLVIGIYVWVSSKKAARVTKITPYPNQGESDNLMQKKEKHPMDMVSTGEDP